MYCRWRASPPRLVMRLASRMASCRVSGRFSAASSDSLSAISRVPRSWAAEASRLRMLLLGPRYSPFSSLPCIVQFCHAGSRRYPNPRAQEHRFRIVAAGTQAGRRTGRIRRQPAKRIDDHGPAGRSRDGRIPARSRHGHHSVFWPAQGFGKHRGPLVARRGRNRREGLRHRALHRRGQLRGPRRSRGAGARHSRSRPRSSVGSAPGAGGGNRA